ncbi:hypothetical protein Tco_1427414 [Tanacetum coccineum]
MLTFLALSRAFRQESELVAYIRVYYSANQFPRRKIGWRNSLGVFPITSKEIEKCRDKKDWTTTNGNNRGNKPPFKRQNTGDRMLLELCAGNNGEKKIRRYLAPSPATSVASTCRPLQLPKMREVNKNDIWPEIAVWEHKGNTLVNALRSRTKTRGNKARNPRCKAAEHIHKEVTQNPRAPTTLSRAQITVKETKDKSEEKQLKDVPTVRDLSRKLFQKTNLDSTPHDKVDSKLDLSQTRAYKAKFSTLGSSRLLLSKRKTAHSELIDYRELNKAYCEESIDTHFQDIDDFVLIIFKINCVLKGSTYEVLATNQLRVFGDEEYPKELRLNSLGH